VFHDEFEILGNPDADGKGGLSSFMNEIRTFRSMEYSVDKTISDVKWVPGNIENISASSINNFDFNKRTENSGTNIPGSIVIWTFEEFANTKIVLKAS